MQGSLFLNFGFRLVYVVISPGNGGDETLVDDPEAEAPRPNEKLERSIFLEKLEGVHVIVPRSRPGI